MPDPRDDLAAIRQHLADLPERLGRVLGQMGAQPRLAPGLAGSLSSAAALPSLSSVQPNLRVNPALDELFADLRPKLATPTLTSPARELRHNPELDALMGITAPTLSPNAAAAFANAAPPIRPATGLPGFDAGGNGSVAGGSGAIYGESPGWVQELVEAVRENTEELRKSRQTGHGDGGRPRAKADDRDILGAFKRGAQPLIDALNPPGTPGTSGTVPTSASSGFPPWMAAIGRAIGGR